MWQVLLVKDYKVSSSRVDLVLFASLEAGLTSPLKAFANLLDLSAKRSRTPQSTGRAVVVVDIGVWHLELPRRSL